MNKLIVKAQAILAAKKAEMYISKVVWVLAVIIVGMTLMWGTYALTNTVVLPSLEEALEAIFGQANTEIENVIEPGYTPDHG